MCYINTPPLLRLLALSSPVVVLLKNIETHLHPVLDALLENVLRQEVRNRAAPNRVGTNA